MAQLVLIEGERFKCSTGEVAARCVKPLGELIGYV
jgi:hypothetical protein